MDVATLITELQATRDRLDAVLRALEAGGGPDGPPAPKYITVKEAAHRSGRDRKTIAGWARDNGFAAIVAHRFVIDAVKMEIYLGARGRGGKAPARR